MEASKLGALATSPGWPWSGLRWGWRTFIPNLLLLVGRSLLALVGVVVRYPILMPLFIPGIKALAGLFASDLDWFWVEFLAVYDVIFIVASLWVFESLVIE